MYEKYETYHSVWRGIPIEINFCEDWSRAVREIQGYKLAHLTIESAERQRLPITETGYKSVFLEAAEVEEYGGVENYLRAWMDYEAQHEEWKAYEAKSNQLKLF